MHIDRKYTEFVRFCIVGALCTALDAAIFYIMRTIVSYQIALVSGYLSGLAINYALTIYWTFQSQPNSRNSIGIVVSHLFNLFVVRMGIMMLLTNMAMMPDNTAYIPTIMVSTCTNFIIIRFIVHKFH